jgi:hypothetical protein
MYLYQAMNRARSRMPSINRVGIMNQVNRTLSGVQSGMRRIGNMASTGKQYGAQINSSLGGALEKNPIYNTGMQVLDSLSKLQ